MYVAKVCGVIAVIAATVLGTEAQAVAIGTPGIAGQGVGFPFGANPGGRYQQVYDSSFFTGSGVEITALTFFSTAVPAAPGATLASGPFTISLSTGVNGVDELVAPFGANVGADSTVVFSGDLPTLSNGRLTINLSTSFFYRPSEGDLLLDVQSPASTGPSVFFDYDDTVLSSRLFSTGDALTPDIRALVTDITAIPEPASLLLLGMGVAGLAGLSRRRTVG